MSAVLANPSKQKGTAFETLVVEYLKERGIACERRALHGNTDKGDIAGVEGWTFELKNRRALDIGGALDEAKVEAKNAGTPLYAAIVKRPRKGSPAEAFAVMPLSLLVDLILSRAIALDRLNDPQGADVLGASEALEEPELIRQQRIAGG